MTDVAESAHSTLDRDTRLRVLVSLTWLLLLPLGWFFTYPFLDKHPILRTVMGVAYVAAALYKPLRWSAYFRKRDWITVAFVLLSSYALAFVATLLWFWFSPPPNSGDWALDLSLFVLGGLMFCGGLILALAPQTPNRLNQLSVEMILPNPATKPSRDLRLG